jgi:bifunctional non-homologous end joining protein LigD
VLGNEGDRERQSAGDGGDGAPVIVPPFILHSNVARNERDKPTPSRLRAYHAKRRAEGTTEPMGAVPPAAATPAAPVRLFMVHKHAARRLHWDLRLEWEGVLLSWAVPKGFSLDPAEKRLAVHVEDHPLEYADYEGVIPHGNYGAGPSIVWDRGGWIPLEPPAEGLVAGKLMFELRGYKLRGVWKLIRTKGGASPGRDWLLVKRSDAWSRPGVSAFAEESVVSGLTVEELPAARERAQALRDELAHAGARERPVPLASVKPMLAEPIDVPFSDAAWIFELKWDGFRMFAAHEDGRASLRYRRGNEATSLFPEIAKAIAALPYRGFVLDGEVVVTDDDGRPRFQRLQKRAQIRRAADVAKASLADPATYFAFDLLAFEGLDLRGLPLRVRKAALQRLLPARGPVRFTDHVEGDGLALWREIERRELEGMVAKKADAPYRAGRVSDWRKLRMARTGDFAVVGLSPPEGARVGFGALHLAAHDGASWVYVGRAGSGFSEDDLVALPRRLLADRCEDPPCRGPLPSGRGHVWVTPSLAVEVRYKDWTADGLLREPVFLRTREDKPLAECDLPHRAESSDAQATPVAPPAEAGGRDVRLTNLDKVFWPADGFVKRDLVEYYRAVAPVLLTYLADRPVVLTRYPDGIDGKSFFQKNAPAFTPGWVRTERFFSEETQREIDMFVCDDVETLLYLANSGTIPLHIGASRSGATGRPDWCLLDLDPKEAPFAHVIEVALSIRDLCRDLQLPAFVKTSGQSGLHVLIPLGGQLSHAQSRLLAELLARAIVHEHPDRATVARPLAARKGRVYVDFGQNGAGRLMAAPYCVRARPGAPVSTPLLWNEVTPDLDPKRFTIRTVAARLQRLKKDPLREVLSLSPDIAGALAKLEARMGAAE